MEHGAPPVVRVLTVGGGAANPAWTALRARILGVPVVRVATSSAAMGAAMLARRALA
jgi:sugar (pentulose or hexulose) kinase